VPLTVISDFGDVEEAVAVPVVVVLIPEAASICRL